MKIAVVGAGIAGLTAAWVLARRHEVALFEAQPRAGGHANTMTVVEDGQRVPVDTGFIVFNELNYPGLCRLFACLGVASEASSMSFSVHCEASGQEYNGSSLNRLFGQRRNLLRPAFWSMLRDILRFNRTAPADLEAGLADSISVADYLAAGGYSEAFVTQYLVPLGASLWSCDARTFNAFPMRFVIEFLNNHHMLQRAERPRWRTVTGGSQRYVEKLLADYRGRIHLDTPVCGVARAARRVRVHFDASRSEAFDEVVLAVHADQALALLERPDARERETLAMFPYRANRVTVHRDTRVLPDRQRLWGAWNFRVPAAATRQATVTYNMNMLQNLPLRQTLCISLDREAPIAPRHVLRHIDYAHPLFLPGRDAAQREHPSLVRRRGVSCCGAYWGYGFHEDGVGSALRVCEAFDLGLPE